MNKNLEIAINASLQAGRVIMEVYNAAIEVEYKEDKSPLTQADKASNEIINAFLRPTEIPIISEENKQIDYNKRKQWQTYWIVDPVDGTKEFIKRNGEFTVNIALVHCGKPLLGVIYVPATKVLYAADISDNTCFKSILNRHDSSTAQVLSNSTPLGQNFKNTEEIRIVGSRSHMNKETQDFIQTIEKTGKKVAIVSKGSSLKFCLVAEGEADIYPRFAPTMEWDTAAGQAICEAVGLKVIDQSTGAPLLYNKENLLNNYFLVSR